MKTILTLCAILLLGIAAINGIAEPVQNIIHDEFFDEQTSEEPSNWLKVLQQGSAGQVKIIDSDSYAGEKNNCLEINMTDVPDQSLVEAVYKYKIILHQNRWYSFAGAIRTEEAASGVNTKLVIRYPGDHSSKPGREIRIIYSLPGETNWQPYNTSFEATNDTNEVEVAFVRRFTKGKAWLDAVYLQTSYYAFADLMISSSVVRRGDYFELRGEKFEPLKKIALFLDNKPFAKDVEILADSKGYFETKLLMPQDAELGIQGLLAKTIDGTTTSFEDDIAVEVLPPLDPKILGLKLEVLKSNGIPKTFKNGVIVEHNETLLIEITGEIDSKASFYVPGVTPEKTIEDAIEYERLPMELVDAKLGIYEAKLEPHINLEIISRVTVELTGPLRQINALESEDIYFDTVPLISKIGSVSVDKTLVKLGETLAITVIGEPGNKAYAYLYNPATESYFTSSKISLKEGPSGVYKINYEPLRDKEAEGLVVIGTMGNDTKEAIERVTIDTKKPGFEVSVDKPQGYQNGETIWIFVKTDLDVSSVSASSISEFDSTNPTIKFFRDSVRENYFVAFVTVSTRNQAPDGKENISITATDKAGNISTAELTLVLKNYADLEEVKITLPDGLSILSLPLNPGDNFTLKDLANNIGENGVMVIIAESGKFLTYLPGGDFANLGNKKVQIGTGYIVVMAKRTEVTFKGISWGAKAAPSAVSAISAVPLAWIEPIIKAVEILPWSESREAALKILYKILPPETRLLQNFPNPFNPETWIPFQLKETAEVTISIYDVSGRLVRRFALGRRENGTYHDRAKASYWNGKNEHGEQSASGVYFYTLKAGKFIATKKMLVLK